MYSKVQLKFTYYLSTSNNDLITILRMYVYNIENSEENTNIILKLKILF